jgi:hypothetical protein
MKNDSPADCAGLLEGSKPKLNRHNNIRPHQPPQATIENVTLSRAEQQDLVRVARLRARP